MDYLNLISIPSIATIVYWIINIIKYTVNNNENFKRFIPLTAALLGMIFGVIAYYALPDIIPAPNLIVAILIGASSGLTATGFNQTVKQLSKYSEEKQNKISITVNGKK